MSLKSQFKNLKIAIKINLIKRNISVEKVTDTLRFLLADNNCEHKYFTDRHISVFEQAHDESALIGQLDFSIDYLSYHLLEFLVLHFNLDEVKVVMDAYKLDLHQFRMKVPLPFFCLTQKRKKPLSEFQEMVTQFEWQGSHCVALEEIELFKKNYAAHYHLRDYSMHFAGIRHRHSTFICSWFIPQCIVDKLLIEADLPRDVFEKHCLSKLCIARAIIYKVLNILFSHEFILSVSIEHHPLQSITRR